MAREPITRAISNVAAKLRYDKRLASKRGYKWEVPSNYLELIDRSKIEADIKAGVPRQTAARKEILRISNLTLTANPSRADITIPGTNGIELLQKIKEWNKAYTRDIKPRENKDIFAKSVFKVDIKKIQHPEDLIKTISKTPLDVIDEKHDRAKVNLLNSLSHANVPQDIIDAIYEKVKHMSQKELNTLLYYMPEVEELFGSNTILMRQNIDKYLLEFGITETKTKIDDKGKEYYVTEFKDIYKNLQSSYNLYTVKLHY